jgi:diamine N-acetyltransferase
VKQYLENAQQDIYEGNCDWRFARTRIFLVGLIDLFDFDPKNNRAGVGIVIQGHDNRKKILVLKH